MTVVVHGLRDLSSAYAKLGRTTSREFRTAERAIAEPVRRDAQALAVSEIRNIGTAWPRMRIGVSRSVVYVAPRQKGTRGRRPGGRPNLADLLMDRAMEPALERNEARVEREVERVVDRALEKFNQGGPA